MCLSIYIHTHTYPVPIQRSNVTRGRTAIGKAILYKVYDPRGPQREESSYGGGRGDNKCKFNDMHAAARVHAYTPIYMYIHARYIYVDARGREKNYEGLTADII